MPDAQAAILYTRDEVVTIAKGMARDPSVVDATARFPVARYEEWLKEAYLYHLSILPLPLIRAMRQKAVFSVPPDGITNFFSEQFDECGQGLYAGSGGSGGTSNIANRPHFCLRVITIARGNVICEFSKSEEEFIKGEASSYYKATVEHPKCFIAGTLFRISPVGPVGGILIYIPRPFFYADIAMQDKNYELGLDAEASVLVAKYVACRKFELDGEGQAYQMLHGEYNEELKNLITMYSSQREDK